MFVSFLFPYEIRKSSAVYLWLFYKQLMEFNAEDICFIGSQDYFIDPQIYVDANAWEANPGNMANLKYSIPSKEHMDMYDCYCIDTSTFDVLCKNYKTIDEAWGFLITNTFQPLLDEIESFVVQILKKHPIEAFITWINNPSLNKIAEKYNVRVINNELGSLRAPFYRQFAFFDFGGVGSNTEATKRYEQFLREMQKQELKLMDHADVLASVVSDQYFDLIFDDSLKEEYEVGVALQTENDSNLVAYSYGLNNFDLLNIVNEHFGKKEILVRMHPSGYCTFKDRLGNIDNSSNSIIFIKKCKRVVSLNSSTCFEAYLLGKPVSFIGESPYEIISSKDLKISDEFDIVKLNFFVFGYMIPYELLFKKDYYRWRLLNPSEIDIFNYHLKYILNSFVEEYNLCFHSNISVEDAANRLYELKKALVSQKIETGRLKLLDLPGDVIAQLFIEMDGSFSEENIIQARIDKSKPTFKLCYKIPDNASGHISNLRWDPIESRLCNILIHEVLIEREDHIEEYDLKLLEHNGNLLENKFISFQTLDPIIIFNICGIVKSIKISGEWLIREESEDYIQKIFLDEAKLLETKESVNLLNNQINALHEQSYEKDKQIGSLNNRIEEAMMEAIRIRDDMNALHLSLNLKSENMEKLNAKLLEIQGEKEYLYNLMLSLKDEISDMKSKLIAKEAENSILKMKLTHANSREQEILNYANVTQDELAVTKEELDKNSRKLDEINRSRGFRLIKGITKLKNID